MKILYLHQYFNTPAMDGGTRSYEMARRMVLEGHEVNIITTIRDYSYKSKHWLITEEAGIKVHWLPVKYSNHMSYAKRIKAFLYFALLSFRYALKIDSDIVFATSTPLTISLPAVLISKTRRIPMVFEVRDLWPALPIAIKAIKNPIICYLSKKLECWAYNNSEAIVALSPGMKEGIIKTGYPSNKVAVIPNSSDNNLFLKNAESAKSFRRQREWLGKRPLLVYAGTLGKINDVHYLINLAVELANIKSEVCILIVGDGSEFTNLMNAAKDTGTLNKNLFFERPIAKSEIPGLLNAANMATVLFLDLPEMRDNSANKFFDALASGTPVLLNYGGWMHDLVSVHCCGLPMWGKSIKEVAKELDIKINHDNWLQKAAWSAKNLAQQYFDRDILAGELIDVLKLALEGRSNQVSAIAPGLYD